MSDDLARVLQFQQRAVELGLLPIWTVYDHPDDMPRKYVARCHVSGAAGHWPTDGVISADSHDELIKVLGAAGLTRLTRHPSDPPNIMETWL